MYLFIYFEKSFFFFKKETTLPMEIFCTIFGLLKKKNKLINKSIEAQNVHWIILNYNREF